jgi:hypothetical protein
MSYVFGILAGANLVGMILPEDLHFTGIHSIKCLVLALVFLIAGVFYE